MYAFKYVCPVKSHTSSSDQGMLILNFESTICYEIPQWAVITHIKSAVSNSDG